jgi:predicted nuclease of predicted toxin-antitoxin system
VRFFVDECLSPQIAARLNEGGQHEAIHPLHVGRRGEDDTVVLARCIAEDRIIVTENARDFRKLVAREAIHPGLIVMPCVDRETSWRLLQAAISKLHFLSPERPEDAIVNHVLVVDVEEVCTLTPLP